MKRRKQQKKKAFMYIRIEPWLSPEECLERRDKMRQFLESIGYVYNKKMGRVTLGTKDEEFNDMRSWQVLLQVSEMKPIAQGAECFVAYTVDDLSKNRNTAKEMIDIIKGMGLEFKTVDGSEIRLEGKEESVFPEFAEDEEPSRAVIAQ